MTHLIQLIMFLAVKITVVTMSHYNDAITTTRYKISVPEIIYL